MHLHLECLKEALPAARLQEGGVHHLHQPRHMHKAGVLPAEGEHADSLGGEATLVNPRVGVTIPLPGEVSVVRCRAQHVLTLVHKSLEGLTS
jgi:hypothetical protein